MKVPTPPDGYREDKSAFKFDIFTAMLIAYYISSTPDFTGVLFLLTPIP